MIKLAKLLLQIANKPQDDLLRFKLLRKVGKVVLPGYRFKWPQLDWWNNKQFNAYLTQFDEIKGANTDRRWMLYQLLRLIETVPGDTAECGVYKGASSWLICKASQGSQMQQRTHYMFDSFQGLSSPGDNDGSHWTEGDLSYGNENVRNNLRGLDAYSLHPGWIPDRFKDIDNKRFCFVHIDVDLYQPTRDSIAFFYPRMNTGGIIVCDDYSFSSCPGATQAVDEFLADKPEKMLSMPCGGGFFVKGWVTARSADL